MIDDDDELSPPLRRSRTGRILRIIGGILLLLIIAGIAAVMLAPQDWLRHLVADRGSGKLGREFAIDGDIHIGWNWTQPLIEINKIRLSNLPDSPDPNMVEIEQAKFRIKIWNLLKGEVNLPELEITRPVVILEKRDAETKNWDFPALSEANAVTAATLPTDRSEFPLIGRLQIQGGKITYRDKTLDLDTTLALDSASGSSEDVFTLAGDGTLQKQAFRIEASGGSLSMLRESSRSYPLDVDIAMGKTSIKVKGTFNDPVNMQGIDTQIDVSGDNMANLFYLTGIPLPPSPPYAISGHLTESNDVWTFDNFKGKMGESDLEGTLVDDTSGKRSYIKASIVSHKLRMEDLGGFIGARTSPDTPQEAEAKENERFLPDMPLNLTRLRASDMDISFKATKIDQPGWPIENMDTHFALKDGLLRIDPLKFSIADGTLSGTLVLDGREDVPVVETDLVLKRLSLKPFFENPKFEQLSQGRFGGRFKITGKGKSLADVLGTSDGQITLIMTGGYMSKLIADAAGLDIGKALPELIGKDESTNIRCAITDFNVTGGLLNSNIFVIDTGTSNIQGDAKINLKDETIDARIQGHPKEPTISGQTPITLTGKLRSPSIGLAAKEATLRGGAAAALAAVLPPAVILPFINVEPGEDSDCRALIEAARTNGNVNPASVAPDSP
ncbi:MAG: AsmA family protein [Bdellovibrionales bacterium]